MSDCAEVGNYQFCIIKDCLVGDLMMSRKVLMDKRFLDQETFFDDQNTETRFFVHHHHQFNYSFTHYEIIHFLR